MRLREIIQIVEAEILSPAFAPDPEVRSGFAADLMSDALRYDLSHALLLSGLANPQVVRTAEMADVAAILLVRGKQPPSETLDLAREVGIPILTTDLIMFEACGRLYTAGLPACPRRDEGR
jgi:predicted transcriptional regulator